MRRSTRCDRQLCNGQCIADGGRAVRAITRRRVIGRQVKQQVAADNTQFDYGVNREFFSSNVRNRKRIAILRENFWPRLFWHFGTNETRPPIVNVKRKIERNTTKWTQATLHLRKWRRVSVSQSGFALCAHSENGLGTSNRCRYLRRVLFSDRPIKSEELELE